MKDRLVTAFSRITLPQALVVVALIAGGVTLALLLPDDRWGGLMRIAVLALGGGGAVGTLFLNGRSSSSSTSEPPPPPSAPPPGRHRSGHVLVDVLLGVVVVAGTLLLAALHSGCGASALRTHVAAAAVVTVALEGGEAAIAAETHRRLDGCAGDAACMESTALELHHAVERTGIEAAFVTVRGLTVSYVEAVRVAALAGDVASVLPYLLEMAGRIAAEWRTLADGMRLLGLELPVPPPLLAASVGGAS